MIEKSNCRCIGAITKPHGIEGELNIRLNKGIDASEVDEPQFMFLELEGGLVPFFVESLRDRGDDTLLVGFETVHSEPKARQLIDAQVWIANDDWHPQMEDDGMIHSSQLIGFKVVDDAHGELGRITELRDPERNPLFVIEGARGEILLPVTDDFITGLDEILKILYVSTPEGLVELNQ